MNDNIDIIETSFWQLLSRTSKIEIPIIQRDFAQGRDDDKTKIIRNRFLESLINAIIVSNNTQELDFVYGSIDDKGTFQPLDGQQRLTTLFLLHWFIAKTEKKLGETKKYLSNFTYKTRISSREFCQALIENGENIGTGKNLSEQIKDASWFFISWKKDPTIKAILVMLDAIEAKFHQIKQCDKKKLWEKLISDDNPPITFHFMELNDFGLSDDLYIKMNARGKALTDFENFKARFEKWINDNQWETDIENRPTQTFSHKVDTVWTDLFWKHRNSKNQIDDAIIKFIAGIAISLYALNQYIYQSEEQDALVREELEEKTKNRSVTNDAIRRERIERRIGKLFNYPNEVNPEDFLQQNAFNYLVSCLDIYSDKLNVRDELYPKRLSLWDYCVDSTLFKEVIKTKETTYKQRVLFYAQTEFIINNTDFDQVTYSDWMRVVRNIVQNSTIDSAISFIGALGLIKELSKNCGDIYFYLSKLSKNDIESKFASKQVDEERLKSKLITEAEDNMQVKQIIHETEDTNFCKGEIKFALYCIDYENPDESFDVVNLTEIQRVMSEHLSKNDISNDFRRALLTIGKNNFYNYWGTWSYGTNSHKKRLIKNTSDLKNNFTYGDYQGYLKELLNKSVLKNLSDIIKDYSCPDEMPNWKKILIKEPKWLDNHGQSKYIGIIKDSDENELQCLLYKHKQRPSSRKECIEVK